jgi:hypothetical protein
MLKQIGFLPILLLTAVSALPQTSTVKGIVVDSQGAVISDAYVLFQKDAVQREHPTARRLPLRTNNHGEFTAYLPSGYYDLIIKAAGFAPYCHRMKTHKGISDIRLVLKINRLKIIDTLPATLVETQPSSVPAVLQEASH